MGDVLIADFVLWVGVLVWAYSVYKLGVAVGRIQGHDRACDIVREHGLLPPKAKGREVQP